MGVRAGVSLVMLLSLITAACGEGAARRSATEMPAGISVQDVSRTLVVVSRTEPSTFVSEELNPTHTGNTPDAAWQIFHAELAQPDEAGVSRLQLAEAAPQLGTSSWKVFPDGRMETTWLLRPNLTWHDGAPLVADDFVLSIQFQKSVGKGGLTKGTSEVEGAIAPDPRTLVIQYKSPFPLAGEVAWQPLPRHILGSSLEEADGRNPAEGFSLPYWTTEFVGLGPYKLERWEPGAFITGVAFPGYVDGKPRIGRIQLVWQPDGNTVVANLLSGTVHLATDLSLVFDQTPVLKREWASKAQPGSILLGTAKTVFARPQFRPEYARPAAMLDVRFRQALAYAIDKQSIVDAVMDGEPAMADTLVAKEEDYYAELDRALTKYPLDLRRTDQLLTEMGFTKDGEGFYGQGGNRLSIQIMPLSNYQREALILVDSWKRAGIESPIRTLSAAEQLDGEIGKTYPAIAITQFSIKPDPFPYFNSANLATPATRWFGANGGGYYDAEVDRLSDLYNASLDRNDRNRAAIQGMALVTSQAANFPLYYAKEVVAHTGNLTGPRAGLKKYAMSKVEEWRWQ